MFMTSSKLSFSYLRLLNRLKQTNRNVRYCTVKNVNKKKAKLIDLLKHQIKLGGPITIANYMKQVLINPNVGYYTNKEDIIGRSGDFITSPEISQMFGELIAVWCMHEWLKLYCPKPLQIVELGPGNGTLMDDMCRVFSKFPDIMKNFTIHLVELNPHLVELQEKKLCERNIFKNIKLNSSNSFYYNQMTKNGIPIYWYRNIDDIPSQFTIYVAHEFLDALPIHKFQKVGNKWHEVLVDFDETNSNSLRYILSRGPTANSRVLISENESRQHVEVCTEAAILVSNIAKRMEEDGGFALFVDYGHDGTKTDTFRAFKHHKLHDPLVDPGTADLTADVDFEFLKKNVEQKAVTFGPVTQQHFLQKMEIQSRLEKLLLNNPKNAQDLILSYKKLTCPTEMGERFKVFSMFPLILKEYNPNFIPAGF